MKTPEEIRTYKREWARQNRKDNPASIEKINERARFKRKQSGKMNTYLQQFNLVGKRFGRLTVLEKNKGTKYIKSTWLCKCDCGNEKVVGGNRLRRGDTKSCGCLRKETSSQLNLTHGDTKSKEYSAWIGMRSRCYNKLNQDYYNYGARGITVCDRWRYSYVNFLEDMGRCPSEEMSLDRIKSHLNYEPTNCRWATALTQANNSRTNHPVTYKGETLNISQWVKKLNIGRWNFYNNKYKQFSKEQIVELFSKKK